MIHFVQWSNKQTIIKTNVLDHSILLPISLRKTLHKDQPCVIKTSSEVIQSRVYQLLVDNYIFEQTGRQTDGWTDRQARQAGRQTDQQTDRQLDGRTDRQTDRQARETVLKQRFHYAILLLLRIFKKTCITAGFHWAKNCKMELTILASVTITIYMYHNQCITELL